MVPDNVRRIHVLLVDDDPDERLVLRALLSEGGGEDWVFEVEQARSLADATQKLEARRPDAILLDYRVGPDAGLKFLNQISGDPERPPVLMMTGYGNLGVDADCLAAGADDFLVKAHMEGPALARALRYAIERRRLVAALARQERAQRQVFDNAPVPMWTFEPETLRFLEVNDAALRQYGYDRETFLGLTLYDLREADERARLAARMEKARAEGKPLDNAGVWRHRRKDGSTLSVEIVRGVVGEGEQQRYIVAAYDVTASIEAEQRLRANEQSLRSVFDALLEGVIVASAGECVAFANGAAVRMLGLDAATLIGSPLPALLGNGGGSGRVEHVDADGRRYLFELRRVGTRWRDQPADLYVLRDLTEQIAANRHIALLQRAVASVSDGIVIVDARVPDQPVIFANRGFENITGYRIAETIGRNCRFLQGADRDQPDLDTLRKAIEVGFPCEVTLRNYRRDGSMFWNRLRLSPLFDEDGSVSHFVGIQSDVSEERRLAEERAFLANHDPLTGLYKYAPDLAAANVLLQSIGRLEGRCAVLFVGLDGYHAINDALGFKVGDQGLRAVAERFGGFVGAGVAMRHAGDEFVLLVPDFGDDLAALAERLCASIAEPMQIGPDTLHLTGSVGAAVFPDTAAELVELVRQAQAAAHEAKRRGRDTAVLYAADRDRHEEDAHVLGLRLRAALNHGEFSLHFQPLVDAVGGRVVGLESLIRWNSSDLGDVPPQRFLAVAEANGMIIPLGRWILRTALSQLREWITDGFDDFILSVNISAAQIQRPGFIDELGALLKEFDIPRQRLELELTETLLIDYSDRALAQMHAMRALGVRIALDDFGVGYSSLGHLHALPIDRIKIDRSFTQAIVGDGKGAALVRAIVAMGHHLGLQVVAEGVETGAQANFLRRAGCDHLQGHLYSRAVAADEVPGLLRTRILGHEAGAAAANGGDAAGAERTLLVLDDEENIRRALLRLLRPEGYRILSAATADEAFEMLATNHVQVVLSDQRMPGMNGTEFLGRVKMLYPDTVRMVLSGYTDLASVTEAINVGAIYKFLTKPWEDEALRAQIRDAFRRHERHRAEGGSTR